MAFREGDKVWIVPNHGGEEHPAILVKISIDGKRALVISGTGTGPRDIPHEVVNPDRRANKALRLTKVTYFYQTAIHTRRLDELRSRDQPALQCPLILWGKLRALAVAGARAKLSAHEFSEWWPDAPAC